jgi:hypothetical protein
VDRLEPVILEGLLNPPAPSAHQDLVQVDIRRLLDDGRDC